MAGKQRRTETPGLRERVTDALRGIADDLSMAGTDRLTDEHTDEVLDAVLGDPAPGPDFIKHDPGHDLERWRTRARAVYEGPGEKTGRSQGTVERDIARACASSYEEGHAVGQCDQRERTLREVRSMLLGWDAELQRRIKEIDRDLEASERRRRIVTEGSQRG